MRWKLIWLVAALTIKKSSLQTINNSLKNNSLHQEVLKQNNYDEKILSENNGPKTPNGISTIKYDNFVIERNIPLELERNDEIDAAANETVPSSSESSEVSPETTTASPEDFSDNIESRSVERSDNIVQTNNGLVKGNIYENTDIISYIDIPYAKLNEPFDPPEELVDPWEDIHEKSVHENFCPQIKDDNYVGDLDCLTLSIFTPSEAENASVLFHIHDPIFGSGNPSIYGPHHLVPKGIILVLPNYRFGALGFLCLGNETAPGNAGLKDLTFALKWVSDNIQSFGGNPTNIVVSGDGFGGALAGYLALYSQSKQFINKVITESGSVLSPWALDRNPLSTANALANKIREESDDFTYNNTFAEVDVTVIVKAAKDMSFSPCLEANSEDTEPFLTETPWKNLNEQAINLTFMSGTANLAGTHKALSLSETFIDNLNEDFGMILPGDLYFETSAERIKQGLKVKEQYFGGNNVTPSHITELSLIYTDASYLSPVLRFARSIVKRGGTVFLYEFGFVGTLNKMLEELERPVDGAIGGDIIGYLFKQDNSQIIEDSPERHMINKMVDLWISFINDGVPTSNGINWSELTNTDETNEEWLLITSDPKMEKGVHTERLKLWTSLYDEYFIERSFGMNMRPNYLISFIVNIVYLISYAIFN